MTNRSPTGAGRALSRRHSDDLRSASTLAVEAVTAITSVVEEMHRTIASGPAILGAPLSRPARALTGIAYSGVRFVTRLVGESLDLGLAQLGPLLGSSTLGPQREAILAALNGILGDHLAETRSSLAIEMCFRRDGARLELNRQALRRAYPRARPRLVVLIHGSSMGSAQWTRHEHNHGARLSKELGVSVVGLDYNSGLHVSSNGRALDVLLERLVGAWPIAPKEIILLGHSMGGLVARSACHYGATHRWRSKLGKLICLGTPHQGASLERAGNLFDHLIGVSRYSAPLARLSRVRSAGVTDLRFGNVLDTDWAGGDRFARGVDARTPVALPAGVACFAIAGTTAGRMHTKLPGDGLVSVRSALGKHARRSLTLDFPPANQWVALGTSHLDLLSRAPVYERIRAWVR